MVYLFPVFLKNRGSNTDRWGVSTLRKFIVNKWWLSAKNPLDFFMMPFAVTKTLLLRMRDNSSDVG